MSVSNLWRMRQFYVAYAGKEKLAPMVREISWTKNILIFEECKDDLERALISKVEIFLREMGDMFTFAGKMQFYLALLDDKLRLEGENPL